MEGGESQDGKRGGHKMGAIIFSVTVTAPQGNFWGILLEGGKQMALGGRSGMIEICGYVVYERPLPITGHF